MKFAHKFLCLIQ